MTPFEKAVEAAESAYGLEEWDDPTRVMGVALTAALSALESEGWVLVPVEPGGFAVEAGIEEMLSQYNQSSWDEAKEVVESLMLEPIYRAMLASRPAPTAPASEG